MTRHSVEYYQRKRHRNGFNCFLFFIFCTIGYSVAIYFIVQRLNIVNINKQIYKNDCCQYETIRYKDICYDVFVKHYKNDMDDMTFQRCNSIPSNSDEILGIFGLTLIYFWIFGFSIIYICGMLGCL